MNRRNMGACVLAWAFMFCHVEALSLVAWTDANRSEMADRIVIGTVEIKEDASIIKVEKVLKGAAEPKWITTTMKPHRRDLKRDEKTKNVLWVERGSDYRLNPLADFCYIKEGSPKWLLYHALVDPAPLVRDEVFERNIDALQMIGYLFDPLKVTSSEAPMVAARMMRVKTIANSLTWAHTGVLDLECSPFPDAPDYRRVDYMSARDESAEIIKHRIEELYFGHKESPVPSSFSIRIDARKIKSVGSLSYEEAAGHLRRHMRLGLDASPGSSDHSVRYQERKNLDQVVWAALNSLMRMRDLDTVPDAVLLASQSDVNLSQAAFDFLASARDPRTLDAMCELLAEYAPKHPEKHWLSHGAARVLGEIGDPAAVPYLEEGVRHGVQSAFFPLARIGGVESMRTIIHTQEKKYFEANAHAPLYWLVKRSNLETEPWMEPRQRIDGSRNDKLRAKWRKWWLAHRDEMKLVRTFEEANRGWEPQWRKDERSGKAYARKHAWKYALGAGVILALLVVYRLRRKR